MALLPLRMALGLQAAVVEDEDLLCMNAGNCKACISLRNPEDTAGDFSSQGFNQMMNLVVTSRISTCDTIAAGTGSINALL